MPDVCKTFDASREQLPPEMVELARQLDANASVLSSPAQTLKAILALGYQITKTGQPVWLPRAQRRIQRQDLIAKWNEELRIAFAGKSPVQITVSDVFQGYANDEPAKIVLGLQVASADTVGSHIVKLGGHKVRRDYEGWKNCFLRRNIASRLLMQVEGCELPGERYAAIYQDAYHLFGTDPEYESPKPFEWAVEWAITDSKPDVRSAERTLVQIFRELNRCLYQDAHDSATSETDRVIDFYRHELSHNGATSKSALDRWQNEVACQHIRRDALWLATARVKPDGSELPNFLDPCDVIYWALAVKQVPSTLVGRSHGDLHGRNILVGVLGGHIEQPAIFDFGDMGGMNLPVWDFVKLETELKTRILPKLFYDADAREKLALAVPPLRPRAVPHAVRLSPEEQEVADRADRLEFAYQFETRLAWLTSEIISRDIAQEPRASERRKITGHAAVDKALCLFYQLRQEAALALGYAVNRAERWRDEFYLALAAYGVLKAKWNVEAPQLEWSLMSAGVAAAQVGPVRTQIGDQFVALPEQWSEGAQPSHLPALKRAHELWKGGNSSAACGLLEGALARFPSAATLRAEYALCLAVAGDLAKAREQVSHLQRLCHIFRDHEMLCRLGRIFKDSGDLVWAGDRDAPDHASFVEGGHPAWQLYLEAFNLYQQAFAFSRHYFPGINAATLALLTGQDEPRRALADVVIEICRSASTADFEDQFWICATEGEAYLVKGMPDDAVTFYRAALANPCAKQKGMVQAMYNQLCRLGWALGAGQVKGILAELDTAGLLSELRPGPFGNCARGP